MSPTSKTTEEPKQTLPVGHPRAAYVSPDLSLHQDTGTLPDSEKEWHEERNEARDSEVEAAEESEDKAAKEEREAADKEAERIRKWKEEHPNPLDPPPPPPPAETTTASAPTTPKTTSS